MKEVLIQPWQITNIKSEIEGISKNADQTYTQTKLGLYESI